MRASRRLALYVALGKKALCTFCGALNETLTISQAGVTVATVTTNAHGITETAVELKTGEYTISGSVSNYTRTLTVKGDGTYNAYPDGAVFWYGNGDAEGDTLFSQCGGFSYHGGWVPSGTAGAGGYSVSNTDNGTHYTHSNSVPGSSGSTYGNSVFTTNALSLEGYDTIHCVLAGNTAKGGWGIPEAKGSQWSPWAYCSSTTPTEQSLYIQGRSAGYFAMSLFNLSKGNSGSISVYAIWRQKKEEASPDTETLSGTKDLSVATETYRYTTGNTAYPWESAGFYDGQSPVENYVGHKSGETNAMLLPIGSFSFTGTSTKLTVSVTGYCPSVNFANTGFRWAICSSDANKALYQTQSAVSGDAYQLSSGIASIAYNNGSYTAYSLSLPAENLPSGQDLYIFLWPNGTYTDVAHIKDTVSVGLYSKG